MLTHLRNPEGAPRRRRSEQPIYSKRRRRRTVILLVGGLATLVIGTWYGIKFFQRVRLEGETFREGVNRRISAALGCKVEFTRLHEGGERSLAATGGLLTMREQALMESAKFSSVNASLTSASWFSHEWGIETLSISNILFKLNPQRAPLSDITPPPAVRESGDGFRWSISSEPNIITLDAVRVVNGLDLEWPGPAGQPPEAIRGLIGGGKIQPGGGGLGGSFVNGTLSLRGLPEISVAHLSWQLAGTRLAIPGARASSGPGTLFEITGHADLVREGTVALKVSIVDSQLKPLLPAAWRERLSGSLAAKDCAFTASIGKGPERTLSGDFTVTGALFSGIGFVHKIAHFLQRTDLSILEFPSLSGHFTWSPSGGLVLTNLTAEREASLRLAGDVTVNAAGAVSGRLTASVSDLTLRARSAAVPHPFRPSGEEGWTAFNFSVSGTAASLDDDIPVADTSLNFPRAVVPNGQKQPAPAPVRDADKDKELERKIKELQPD